MVKNIFLFLLGISTGFFTFVKVLEEKRYI